MNIFNTKASLWVKYRLEEIDLHKNKQNKIKIIDNEIFDAQNKLNFLKNLVSMFLGDYCCLRKCKKKYFFSYNLLGYDMIQSVFKIITSAWKRTRIPIQFCFLADIAEL